MLTEEMRKSDPTAAEITAQKVYDLGNAKTSMTLAIAEATENLFKIGGKGLTNVYRKNYGQEDAVTQREDTPERLLNALRNRKPVNVRATDGGSSVPWNTTMKSVLEPVVPGYLEHTEMVRLTETTFGYPTGSLVAFEKDGVPPPGVILLIESKQDPCVWAVRRIEPGGNPRLFVDEAGKDGLRMEDWTTLGWGYAWAEQVGHSYPRFITDFRGLMPQ